MLEGIRRKISRIKYRVRRKTLRIKIGEAY